MGRLARHARLLAAVTADAVGQPAPRAAATPTLYAACDRRGVIEFLDHVPPGLIGIIAGSPSAVTEIISASARHAYDGETLLVPGVPEAESDQGALDALWRFRERLAQRHPRMVRAAR